MSFYKGARITNMTHEAKSETHNPPIQSYEM